MIRTLPLTSALAATVLGLALAASSASAQAPIKTIRVGWCAKTLSSGAAPFAVANKLGYFEQAGIKVEMVPLPGSTDCLKFVATKELPFSIPSAEPIAALRSQGVKIRYFYTAYQRNVYGLAVPIDSAIKEIRDLKGKRIGVTSMASGGFVVARALAQQVGLNPDSEVSIVVAGEGAQTAALVRQGAVDALAQFDTQYALVEAAGVKLRHLSGTQIERFPSNGFVALEETLKDRRADAVALGRGYAMGTIFALNNPEAAVRIMWSVWPQVKSTGKDEATALRDDIATLQARADKWLLEPVGAKRWGESLESNYQSYFDWLYEHKVHKERLAAKDVITNDLIEDIGKFDATQVIEQAKTWKPN